MENLKNDLIAVARAELAALVSGLDFTIMFGELMERTEHISGWRDPILDALHRQIVKEIKDGPQA